MKRGSIALAAIVFALAVSAPAVRAQGPAPETPAPAVPAARIPIVGYELGGSRIDSDDQLRALMFSVAALGDPFVEAGPSDRIGFAERVIDRASLLPALLMLLKIFCGISCAPENLILILMF